MRRGVNARLTSARNSVWYGGSWKIIGANALERLVDDLEHRAPRRS